MAIAVLLVVLILYFVFKPKKKLLEKDYQEYFCKKFKGKMEAGLSDNDGRVDCLLSEYAVEVKRLNTSTWWGCVGQSLFYAIKTDKKPAILAILEEDIDYKQLEKLKVIAMNYSIKVWTIDRKLQIKAIV
jgi:hypothetical protein